MEAKARGATVIHVDPRFTRTSAVSDMHVPLRAGTDIAFLGGLINHVLENDLWFHEYVTAYTNAATLVGRDYQDTEDLDGLFSGWNDETRSYDPVTWQYEGVVVGGAAGDRQIPDPSEEGSAGQDSPGETDDGSRAREEADSEKSHSMGSGGATLGEGAEIQRDETLQDPRCVINVLRRHYSRYTPEMVEKICGVPREQFLQVAEALTRNSGRERTSAFVYAVGWTHHTTGVQYIRTAAILQLLLGNIGRPGGGILALRGHASIQGSTDIPTLYNILPGYIPMPHAGQDATLEDWVGNNTAPGGYWGHFREYAVSLLKAWWGDAATPANDFSYDHLPRLTGDHSSYPTMIDMREGKVDGFFVMGENPAVGSANSKLHRLAMASARWLVVRDLQMVESATFWKDGPEIETGELRPEEIDTEIFFLPAATHTEK